MALIAVPTPRRRPWVLGAPAHASLRAPAPLRARALAHHERPGGTAYDARVTTATDLAAEKYLALTTYRRTGEGVTTPVWVVQVPGDRIGFWTAMGSGKTKRMRHTPRVTVQPCDARGRVKPGSTPVTAVATMVQAGPEFDEVQAKGKAKYGLMVPLTKALGRLLKQRRAGQTYADTVVVLDVSAP